MLRWVEKLVRRPLVTPLVVGGVAGGLAALGGGWFLTLLWALPAGMALEVLRLNRSWIYLLLRREALAVEAARSLLEEFPEGPMAAYQRLAGAAGLLRLRRTLQAKALLREVDPEVLGEGARPGYFLLQGVLYVRLGDAAGVADMARAAGVLTDPEESSATLLASVENLRAVGLLLEGRVEEASALLEDIPLGGVGRETRAVIWNNRAWTELRRGGDPARALEWAARAARGDPSEPSFQGTLGAALLELDEEPREAARCLRRALVVAEDMAPQERSHLLGYAARALLRVGDEAGARELAGRIGDIPGAGRPERALPAEPGEGAPRRAP